MSLAGKKILITRPIEQAAAMGQSLRERNADPVYFSTIRIVPPASWDACDEAIDNYRTYHGVIITSVNAAKYFFNRAVERGLQPGLLPNSKVYVVGAKTAEAVASYGIAAARFPGVNNVHLLAEALCALPVLRKRFLFPKGNLAGSEITIALRVYGASVDEVTVYETAAGTGNVPHDPAVVDAAQVYAMLRSGTIDAIAFYSTSSVENFFAAVPPDAVHSTALAAIGSTTADALRTLALSVPIVPEQPTTEDLVSALEQYFL